MTEFSNKVILISREGEKIEVGKTSALISGTVAEAIGDDMDAASMEIPTNVDSQMLKKMAEFMILYQNSPFPEVVKPLKSSKLSDLVPDNVVAYLDVDKEVLYDMVIAADFLNIKPLLDAACAKIATFTKDKTEEQIRQAFM